MFFRGYEMARFSQRVGGRPPSETPAGCRCHASAWGDRLPSLGQETLTSTLGPQAGWFFGLSTISCGFLVDPRKSFSCTL
jgi:hypothetical protein